MKKTIELTMEIRPDYMYARVLGTETNQTIASGCLHHILGKCRAFGRDRLMLERDTPSSAGSTSINFTDAQQEYIVFDQMKVALVDTGIPADESVEVFAKDHGGNLKIFSGNAAATAWLLS